MKEVKRKIDYKWIIAAMCFIVLFVGVGFCSSAKNIFIAPITSAMGFSRSAYTLSDTFRYATTAIVTMFLDRLISRFGIRKLLVAGMISYVISSLLNAFATSLWMFYLGGVFLGIGIALAAITMASVIINKWFTKNRGTVLGVVLASNGLGSAVAIWLFEPLIYEVGNPFGFRNAYFLSAAIVAVVTVLVAILYRDKTDENEEAEIKEKRVVWEGFEYDELTRKPSFYIVISCLFVSCLFSLYSIATPYYTDVGFDSAFVAITMSVFSVGLIFAKILAGIIYDRFGLRMAVNICLIADIVSKILVMIVTVTTTGKALAIAQSALKAVAMPIETVLVSIIVLDLFGQKSFNKALAIVTSVFTVGQAVNQPFLNLPFDISGSYLISFVASVIASIVVVILMNFAISSVRKDMKNSMNKSGKNG